MSEDESGTGRLIFFSDAVVAIAMTLLALELPVPTGNTTPAFWRSVRQDSGHYAAFLISFLVIAALWSHHHDVMRYLVGNDKRLRSLNMVWLLAIVLVPFATKLLTSQGHQSTGAHALRFSFYALLQILASGSFLAMVRHIVTHGLCSDTMPAGISRRTQEQCLAVAIGFGLSIPIFFVTKYGWLMWFISLATFGQVSRRRDRRERASAVNR